jgi:PAS domain S-box-containing protein
MHVQDKSWEQLIAENEELKRRLAALDSAKVEQDKIVDALRDSERRYRALAESANDIIYILDREGNLLYANQAASRAIGIPADQLVGKRQSDLFPPDVARRHVESVASVYATGIARSGDEIYQLGTGQVWLRTHLMPLRDDMGNVTSLMGVCHDITDRKLAEMALQQAREELVDRIEERTAELQRANELLQREVEERRHVEASLRDSEDKYRTLVEASPDAVLMTDLQGHITFASRRAAEMYGSETADQLHGKNPLEFFAPEDHGTFLENLRKTLETGVTSSVAYTLVREDGSRFAGEVSAAAVRDSTGSPRAIVAVVRDTTEKKQVQEALATSHDELRAIYDGMFDGLIILDLATQRVVKANPSICRMLGYTDEELCLLSLKDMHPSAELPRTMQRIQARAEGTFAGRATVPILRKDGEVLIVDITSNVLEYRGRPCLAGFFRDMTDQRRAADELRASEERFRVAFEEAPVGIIMVDANGITTRVNQTFCQLSGYPEAEIIGSSIFGITHPEDRDNSEALSRRLLSGEIPSFSMEKRYLKKDGGYFWAQMSAAAMHDREGRVLFALGIIEDMTDRKKALEALEREHRTLEHMLQASDHERQLIAYDIHDGLAQELAGTIMQFQLYAHARESKPQTAAMTFNAAIRMLDASYGECRRLISGVRPPILDEFGVAAAIAHLVYEPAFDHGPTIELRNRVRFKRLAPIVENVIYRVVQEGITNARKHSNSGKVRVSLVQRADRLRIKIRDWGVGFDPTRPHENRFGIEGIRQRARLLGGMCSIKSKRGKGTCILVELPIVEREENQ